MKKILLLVLTTITYTQLNAQFAERSVVSVSGGSYFGPTFSVDYTIGETFISTYIGGTNVLTSGFQQPDYLITKVEETQNNLSVSFYPNPCVDNLTIAFGDAETGKYSLNIYDMLGRAVYTNELSLDLATSQKSVDLSSLSTGSYYVKIASGSKQLAAFKIVKITN